MKPTDLSATSAWRFSLDMADDEGPLDMTGTKIAVVMLTKENVEICRATTDGGDVVIAAGPSDVAPVKSRLDVTILSADHASLIVARDFVAVDCQVGLWDNAESDWDWLGKKEFHVHAGPAWGATGA